MTIALVWAQSADRWIGAGGTLPWHLPEDLARFRTLTSGHPVIMGRTTWESLPARFRPLPGRDNIVLSRRPLHLTGAAVAPDVDAALELVGGRDAWVIGGAQVYAAFLPLADRLEVTQVDTVVAGDTRAPVLDGAWQVVDRDPPSGWRTSTVGLSYRFLSFARASAAEPDGAGASAARTSDDALA
ncbi:MAG: dihydrofolate reductase [Actinotalea sp.]|jgi:dihydrofolate reductase|nr:dihydrofolate reductase [Actinotalea sp.]